MQFRTLIVGSAMLALLAGCAAGPTDDSAMTPRVDDTVEAYQGTLPCRNCAGIDINVQMSGEEQGLGEQRTFELQAAYREHPQNPPEENYAGNWEVISGTANDPDATVYELTPDGEGQIYYFLRIDGQTLELIDPQLRRFQNNEALQLQRQ